jgi:uncharacterized membrane protein YoaK (UPF0700 family)
MTTLGRLFDWVEASPNNHKWMVRFILVVWLCTGVVCGVGALIIWLAPWSFIPVGIILLWIILWAIQP